MPVSVRRRRRPRVGWSILPGPVAGAQTLTRMDQGIRGQSPSPAPSPDRLGRGRSSSGHSHSPPSPGSGSVRSRPAPSVRSSSPTPSQARRLADRGPTPTATPSPTPEPDADARPDADTRPPRPSPTPTPVPAPLTGRLVSPSGRQAPPDRGDDRRPRAGPAAVRASTAPTSCGTPRPRAASRATWRSSRTSCRKAIGPVRSARYYYIAWAAEWKAVYVHAGGSPQALATLRSKGRGQYVYNADEFRWGGTLLPPDSRRASRRTTSTRAARTCASWRTGSGAKDDGHQAGLAVRARTRRCRRGRTAARITVVLPAQHDHLPLRPRDRTPTCAR